MVDWVWALAFEVILRGGTVVAVVERGECFCGFVIFFLIFCFFFYFFVDFVVFFIFFFFFCFYNYYLLESCNFGKITFFGGNLVFLKILTFFQFWLFSIFDILKILYSKPYFFQFYVNHEKISNLSNNAMLPPFPNTCFPCLWLWEN